MPTKFTRISVKVKTDARTSKLEAGTGDGQWRAWLKSSPVDGKANQELVTLLAKHFACHKKDVTIKVGKKARLKLVEIKTA